MLGRKLWFQIHKWIGLLLFVILIPLSASGSLLVWRDWTDSLANPQRYRVSDAAATLAPSVYVEAARDVLPAGARLASIELPSEPGRPVVVTASTGEASRRPGPPPRYQVWLDPATASVVDHANASSGILRVLHVFHGSLMVPGLGRTIVGLLGLAMLVSCLTGIWLWWPMIGSVLKAFRWRRGPLFSGNLHHQIGIWIALPLAVLSLTGAYISFPGIFASIERAIAGGQGAPAREAVAARRARPLEAPNLTPDSVVAIARVASPRFELASLRWPTEKVAAWQVEGAAGGRKMRLAIDDASAAISLASEPGGGDLSGTMRELHDGHSYNAVWQTIIFVAGLAPALLGITGVIMWLRTRAWRRRAGQGRAIAAGRV